jgi:hypothetical protein
MDAFNTIFGNLLTILTGVAVAAATLFFAWGAMLYLTSGGSPQAKMTGVSAMRDALVGLGLIFAARVIVAMISTAIPH